MATETGLAKGKTSTNLAGGGAQPGPTSSPSFAIRLRQMLQLRYMAPYIFVAPFLVAFVFFFVAPFVYAISQSLYTVKHSGGLGLTPPKTIWVGIDNYVKAIHDPSLWAGFGRVLLFGVVQIPVMMGVALIFALLMDSAVIRFKRFFRLSAFLPYAVPSVVAAIMWGFFYTPRISPIYQTLTLFNIKIDLLGQSTVLWSIANISTWEYCGYNMIIFFAALQAIPQEIYESGRMDGLSEIGIARFLKVPMILPAVTLGLLFSIIGTLQLFNEPQLLSRLSPAINADFTPNIYAYNIAIVRTDYNYGGAIAVILGLVTFVFSYVFMRVTSRQSGA